MKIAFISNQKVANYLKLAGYSDTYSVKNEHEAQKRIFEIITNKEFAIIALTNNFAIKLQETINKITEEHEYPIIITIPQIGEPPQLMTDLITELIKRKTGIELKT
jgi:vacuolar-type H+-ATPase subunit F/Vma7